MAEDRCNAPRTRDDAGDKTPCTSVDEAVEDTPVHVNTKKAAELKIFGISGCKQHFHLPINRHKLQKFNGGLSSSLGRTQDDPDS
jgi:hypothetical protein